MTEIKFENMVAAFRRNRFVRHSVRKRIISTYIPIGICNASRDFLTMFKTSVLCEKDIDRNMIIEKLADLEFYMEGLRQELNITRQEIIKTSIQKLQKPQGYLK